MDAFVVRNLGVLHDDGDPLAQKWERLVKQNTASGLMQSLAWAEAKRRQGMHTVHLGVFRRDIASGDPRDQFAADQFAADQFAADQFAADQFAADQLVAGAMFFTSAQSGTGGLLVAPEGPVIPWDEPDTSGECLRLLTAAIQEYGRERGVIAMRIEPRLPTPAPPLLREFGRAPVDLVPRETLYLNLLLGEDALLSQMKPKGRYNISVAQRSGVVVSQHTVSDVVPIFYEAVQQASVRAPFALEAQPFFTSLAEVLCPAGIGTILLARHDDDLLGALLLTTYGERATYLYGGTTDVKRQMMGGYALQWAAIKESIARGCTTYDFYGYVPHHFSDHPYARFSQFKSQFGGTARKFIGAQDYFFMDNMADAFVRAVGSAS